MTGDSESRDGETAIEDVSGLRIAKITSRAHLNIHEAENIRKATVAALSSRPSRKAAPMDVAWMLKLHRDMLGDVWEWAGTVRKTQTNIGVAPPLIVEELKKLADDIAFWTEHREPFPIETAARLHHRAAWIHPFNNGNGRWARLLANVWLRREGHAIIRWPDDGGGETSPLRARYLAAMRAADHQDFQPLISLLGELAPALERGR